MCISYTDVNKELNKQIKGGENKQISHAEEFQVMLDLFLLRILEHNSQILKCSSML